VEKALALVALRDWKSAENILLFINYFFEIKPMLPGVFPEGHRWGIRWRGPPSFEFCLDDTD
jgi:hypothetical protein